MAIAAAVIAGWRVARGHHHVPGALRVAVTGALVAVTLVLLGAALRRPEQATWLLPLVLPMPAAVVASAVGVMVLRTRWIRASVEAAIVGLDSFERGDLVAQSGAAVSFAVPGGGWVDPLGRSVPAPVVGPRHPVISDEAGPAASLELRGQAEAQELLAGLTPGLRIAVANARLTALARAHARELQQAQRQAVASSDAERTRIERDLHDGAQQQLVSAALHLGVARARGNAAITGGLGTEAERLREVLERLRQISHGPFPEVLVEDGLEAALADLVGEAAQTTRLTVRGPTAVGVEAARAAYATVAAVLRAQAHASRDDSAPTEVSVLDDDATVRVSIRCGTSLPPDADLTPIADRVGALGGTLGVAREQEATVVTAVIPCGS
jgi:signal transduction histidine kinase